MDSLLTDEEIIKYSTKNQEYCDLAVAVGIWARDETKRKLVEWMEGACPHWLSQKGNRRQRRLCHDCWQALRKEVGDG